MSVDETSVETADGMSVDGSVMSVDKGGGTEGGGGGGGGDGGGVETGGGGSRLRGLPKLESLTCASCAQLTSFVFDVDGPGPGPSPGGGALTLSPAPAASLLSRLTRVSLRMCLSLTAVHLTSPLPSLLSLDLARCSSLAVSPARYCSPLHLS